MDGLRDHLARFRDTFLSSDHSHMSVNDMWVSFKSEVIAAIERFIPTKMTKTKLQFTMDRTARSDALLENARNFIFVLASQAALTFKSHYKTVQSTCSKGHQRCILEAYFPIYSLLRRKSPDPDSPRKNEKAKKFWSFVKSLKNDRVLGSTHLGKTEF